MIGQFLHRRLLLPAFETGIKRRKTLRYWNDLECTQWLNPAALARVQFNALRKLLHHAVDHCPYYREEWRTLGLDPTNLQSLQDFHTWPIIDRDTIRAHRMQMRASSAHRLIQKSTGGSSGVPLHFDLDITSHERRTAAAHRGYAWAGAGPGALTLRLWGVPLGRRSLRQRCKDRLFDWLYRTRTFNSFDLSRQREEKFLHQLNNLKPDVIVAYTNPLYTLARSLDERGIKPFAPRSIVVGAEKLHDFQRTLIEKVFRAPVFETYGSREFMLIGAECERHNGLHLTNEQLLVEILDDQGHPTPPGEEGNVVITDLFNYGMPFIRYANGDRAIASESQCLCGRGLSLLTKVTGRQLDILQTPDGRQIPGEFFPHLLKDFQAVQRFQVVQERPDHVQLRLTATKMNSETRRLLEASVRDVLGSMVQFELLMVDDIPLSPAGKLQVVINRAAINQLSTKTNSQTKAA